MAELTHEIGSFKISFKGTIVFLLSAVSLLPITFETEKAGLFISYFYVLLLVMPFTKHRFSKTGLILIAVFTIVYAAGFFKFFVNGFYYFVRVTISYVVFMLPLLLIFIKVEDWHLQKFKQAVIFCAIAYSLWSIIELAAMGYSGDFYQTKDMMGSNRFGFVIIFAFFVLLYEDFPRLLKIGMMVLMLIGLALTFSRSSIVAFAAAAIVFAILNLRRIKLSHLFFGTFFTIVLLFVFRETVIGQIVDFFGKYLLGYDQYAISNSRSSEGYRLYVFKQIITYVTHYPLFGSNFAGLYLLYDEYSVAGASAHSQYTDVLLRTGLVGFLLYLYILFKITAYYRRTSPAIFFGLVGILFYGLFHETFKLAHGSYIFAILLSYYLNKAERPLKVTIQDDKPSSSI